MRVTINTNESNKILTAPIERILDSIAYTMYIIHLIKEQH